MYALYVRHIIAYNFEKCNAVMFTTKYQRSDIISAGNTWGHPISFAEGKHY